MARCGVPEVTTVGKRGDQHELVGQVAEQVTLAVFVLEGVDQSGEAQENEEQGNEAGVADVVLLHRGAAGLVPFLRTCPGVLIITSGGLEDVLTVEIDCRCFLMVVDQLVQVLVQDAVEGKVYAASATPATELATT